MTHLVIDELDTKNIGQVEDRLVLGVIGGGRCDIGLDAVDHLNFACDEKNVKSSTERAILMLCIPSGVPS
jgi:hypothetical protein